MSPSLLDRQAVGYISEEKKLIVTLSDKMAQQMKADGWTVSHEKEVGYFIKIQFTEEVI